MKQENKIYYTVRKEKNKNSTKDNYLLCYSCLGSQYIDFYDISESYHNDMSYLYYLNNTKRIKSIEELPIYIKNQLLEYCKPCNDCDSIWIFRNKLKHNSRGL